MQLTNAECRARELRLKQPNSSLALCVDKMVFDKKIYISTFQNYADKTGIDVSELILSDTDRDGYTVKYKDYFLILYNDTIDIKERQNWTLAHELGHIYLEHTADDSISEIEAHWFAAELLVPQPLLNEIAIDYHSCEKDLTTGTVQRLFGISNQAAKKALCRMCTHQQYNHYLEDRLIKKYEYHLHDYSRNCAYIY